MRIGAYASTDEAPTIAIHQPKKFHVSGVPLEPVRLYIEWEEDAGDRAGFMSLPLEDAKEFHALLGERIAEAEASLS